MADVEFVGDGDTVQEFNVRHWTPPREHEVHPRGRR